jgi:hypothetical protein
MTAVEASSRLRWKMPWLRKGSAPPKSTLGTPRAAAQAISR